jgi:lipopolysaccharide transport system ATP-binding protein
LEFVVSDLAVRVENLSKRYRIGGPQARYKTLRESLADMAAAPARRLRRLGQSSPEDETIWALKDVSFEVKKGEVVGIIGRNGAGKTTLLRILSRITEPTEGQAEIKGRVGSLLEVGTGFHPELTGRENIYLNGAILGMKRAEIDQRFDEIVAFSEIEKFLDTPVKRYSSGMYVRLAFSVAAHLEPEILLVDEVLAVGDAAFQKKCLGKMGDVAHEGRTVLFVSHNMDAILRLCSSAVYLRSGRICGRGRVADVVNQYASEASWSGSESVVEFDPVHEDKRLAFTRVALVPATHRGTAAGSQLECHISYQVPNRPVTAVMAIRIDTITGAPVMTLTDNDLDETRFHKQPGTYRAVCPLPVHLLAPGTYRLTVSAADMAGTRFDYHEGVLSFDVPQPSTIKPTFRREGPLLLPIDWRISKGE